MKTGHFISPLPLLLYPKAISSLTQNTEQKKIDIERKKYLATPQGPKDAQPSGRGYFAPRDWMRVELRREAKEILLLGRGRFSPPGLRRWNFLLENGKVGL